MLTKFSVMGALASITSLISVVLASPLSGGEAAIPAAVHPSAMDQSTSHSPAHSTLKPRYDYEPGDELKRTMCFGTSDPSLEQLDNDPYTFKNV
ncbi:MAG: hypothetical protein Q9199_005639, partial [Rusavskia elegans]